MKKIKFEDLPSQNSPINATNLNQMQDNIENAINNTGEWQDLEIINGWENYDTSIFYPGQIKKDKSRIYLRGVLKLDNKTDNIIAYLPEEYRPEKALMLPAITNITHETQEARRLTVYPDGRVLFSYETTITEVTGYVSIDGLYFDID